MTASDLHAVAEYLDEYLDVQQSLLDVMASKLDVLSRRGMDEAKALEEREVALVDRLRRCVDRRREILEDPTVNADRQPTLRGVVRAAEKTGPALAEEGLSRRIDDAERVSREVRMRSVSAWVLAQRSVVHWSQMLEIIAAQGQPVPTYKRDRKLRSRGALMDREA